MNRETGGVRFQARIIASALIAGHAVLCTAETRIIEHIPAGLTLHDIAVSSGTVEITSGTLIWNVSLPPGTSATLIYDAAVETTACHKTYSFDGVSGDGFWTFPIVGDTALYQADDGWRNADIPWVDAITIPPGYEPAGRSEYFACDGSYRIWGSGTTLQDSPYEFHFLYAWVLGDFEISVRASHISPHNDSENVGVMVRAGPEPGAANVHLKIKGDGRLMGRERLEPGGPTGRFNDAGSLAIMPNTGDAILRLSRQGETISLGVDDLDDDGNPAQFPWLVADGPRPNIPTDRPVMVGLFYNSMVDGVLQSGHFRDVYLSGTVSSDADNWMLYR